MFDLVTLSDGSVLDVSLYPLPEGQEDGVLSRVQIARAFKMSENTITKWTSQGMPVEASGGNGTAYEYRLSHCYAWRMQRDTNLRAEKSRGDNIAAQAAMSFRNLDIDQEEIEGKLTAKELREWSEAEYQRNKAAQQRGDLVRSDRTRALLEGLLVNVRMAIDTLPDFMEREFGLTSRQVAQAQERCDEVLIEMQTTIARDHLGAGRVVPLGDDARQSGLLV